MRRARFRFKSETKETKAKTFPLEAIKGEFCVAKITEFEAKRKRKQGIFHMFRIDVQQQKSEAKQA